MDKPRESSADRLWKEKLEECCSANAAVALAVVLVVFGGLLLVG